jgi:peptide/nickel transport system permease protein
MTAFLKRFHEHATPLRYVALAVVVAVVAIALFAPLFAPHDPIAQDVANKLRPVGTPGHPLGTDQFGRDSLSRLIYGARIEIVVALGATLFACIFGTFLGLMGGYFGRLIETVTMRLTDVILAFPPIILALLIVTIYGSGVMTLIVVMGLLFAPNFARITYGQVVGVKHAEYVEAAKAIGAPTPRILLRVVLPNIMSPIAVQMSLTLASAILLESGLSFLGLGVVPPTASWGLMVAEGQRFMASNPDLLLAPAIAVVATILSFSVLGDALRDWLDPRSRKASAPKAPALTEVRA